MADLLSTIYSDFTVIQPFRHG